MKKTSIISIIFLLLFSQVFQSCEDKYPASEAEAFFEVVESQFSVLAPVVLRVVAKGDFVTFFPGDEGREYNNPDSMPRGLGVVVNDSIVEVKYPKAGRFTATLVAVSYGEYGNQQVIKTYSQEIVITDKRNTITKVEIASLKMSVVPDANDTIKLIFGEGQDIEQLATSITLNSPGAKVAIETTSGSEIEHVAGGPIYYSMVKAFVVYSADPDYVARRYPVLVGFKPLSTTNTLNSVKVKVSTISSTTQFSGIIDQEAKTVKFLVPSALTGSSRLHITANSSGNTMSYNNLALTQDSERRNLQLGNKILKVVAENGDVNEYTFEFIDFKQFASYSFNDLNPVISATVVHPLNPGGEGTISLTVLNGTNLSSLVATFTGNEAVTTTVNGVEQVSGVTANNFSDPNNPVIYKVENELIGAMYYKVLITVL
jgi:hypothetical protein